VRHPDPNTLSEGTIKTLLDHMTKKDPPKPRKDPLRVLAQAHSKRAESHNRSGS
jgi:predicted transcriptional regulator